MLNGILTGILLVVFIGIVIWAYGRGRRRDFEEASRLPLDEEDRRRHEDRNNGSAK